MSYNNYQPYMGYNPYNYQYQNVQTPFINNYSQNQVAQQPTTQPISQVNNTLTGWIVDGFDVTKSINADMSGNPMFFPSSDGTEIYKKQLDINTGKPVTYVYKLENNTVLPNMGNNVDFTELYANLNSFKASIQEEISELKDLLLNKSPSSKGGTK